MSSRQSGKTVGSWLDVVAGLLATEKKGRRRPVARKLSAERLERRTVLSTASVPATAPADDGSLAMYLAQPHPMGPIVPSASAGTVEESLQGSSGSDSLSVVSNPAPTDHVFSTYDGEGEGDGSGSGSGSGSGAGRGSGAGSGSGSSAGSGSGTGDPSPTITDTNSTWNGDTFVVSSLIGDDDGLGGLTVSIDGASGSATLDANGQLNVAFDNLTGNGTITITVTDANGNVTTYSVDY
jgi:hypothetical protein